MMISSVEELLDLVDQLKARGVEHFKVGDLEVSLVLPKPQGILVDPSPLEDDSSDGPTKEELFWSSV